MSTLELIPAAQPAVNAVSLSVHPASARPLVLTLWRALEHTHPDLPIACSADWTEAWLNHFGSTVPHQFCIWHHDTTPVAAALITHGQWDDCRLVPVSSRHVGTAGEPDTDSICIEYNALLCLPDWRGAVWKLLLEWFAADFAWDTLHLDGFEATELDGVVDSTSDWCWTRKAARYVDLDEIRTAGRELISVFGDSTRQRIRQNLRHFGPVDTVWAETAAEAHSILDDLIRLHQQRWQTEGQPGCYASAPFTEFHRELVDRLVPRGLMTLVRVTGRDGTLGCSQILIDRNRALLYQGGRLAHDSKRSPGLVTDFCAMQTALERGCHAFDFMAGDSQHKQRLTTHTRDLLWGVLRRPRLKFAVMDQLRQIKRWLKTLQFNEGTP